MIYMLHLSCIIYEKRNKIINKERINLENNFSKSQEIKELIPDFILECLKNVTCMIRLVNLFLLSHVE